MEQMKLSKAIPEIEFKFNSEDSYLLIHHVCVKNETNSTSQWRNFISNVHITAVFKYVVFDDPEERFNGERSEQFSIHLLSDPFQDQPVFQLNKLIKKKHSIWE